MMFVARADLDIRLLRKLLRGVRDVISSFEFEMKIPVR
jgi:hypothetical protein